MDKKQPHTMKRQGIGTNFDDFLEEEGMLAEAEAVAIKRVIAYQLEETMKKEHITKTEMAKTNAYQSQCDRSSTRSTQYLDHPCNHRKCGQCNG